MISNRQLFLRNLAQTSTEPMMIEVEKAEGIYLHSPDGKKYIDFISGIGVSNVGHSAPEIVKAIQDQSTKYLHTMVYGEYVMSPQVKYAEKLVEEIGGDLDSVYFVNSGSEAVEGALKIAKKFTGRGEIVAFQNSYHGSTHGALSVTGCEPLKKGYGPFLPGVTYINFNNLEDLDAITDKTACVIVEPIQAEAGIILPEDGYLEALRKKCNETGTLLILDEIQTGFGRAGALFVFKKFGIRPDILLLAKSLGGGMPLGAFISSPKIMQVLMQDPVLGHITTFGGHPICCAAGLAALNKIIDENLIGPIPAKEKLIKSMLVHPKIRALRGAGLMFGIVLDSFDQVKAVVAECMENGLIIDWFLHADYMLRVAPPLIITEEELEHALKIILDAIGKS